MPNKKVLDEKMVRIADLSAKMKESKSIILADYRGLTVEEDTQLRNALRAAGVHYSVIKNTIIKFAAVENGMDSIIPFLEGPTAVAISNTDEVIAAKVISDFAKKHVKLELKAGIVEGKAIDANGVKALAELPSKDVLIARALGGLKAPIAGFVNVLNGNLRGLVVALNAIKDQKESA